MSKKSLISKLSNLLFSSLIVPATAWAMLNVVEFTYMATPSFQPNTRL